MSFEDEIFGLLRPKISYKLHSFRFLYEMLMKNLWKSSSDSESMSLGLISPTNVPGLHAHIAITNILFDTYVDWLKNTHA